jgi:iron(III) transport system substrate-binding protein
MKRTRRTWLAVLLAMGLLTLASACGSDASDDTSAAADSTTTTAAATSTSADACADTGSPEWEKIVAAAKAEGSVVLYHSKSDVWAKTLLDAFEAKYGVKGTSFRSTSGPLIQRIEQELAAGKLNGDVVLSGDPVYAEETYGKKGDLLEPTGPAVEAYPSEDISNGVVTMGRTPLGILYNTNAITTPPTDWDDMLHDDYSVGLVDPAATTNWSAVYDLITKNVGADYLKKLSAQDSKIDMTSVTIVQSIVAGELDWTPFGFGYNLNQFGDQKVPLAIVYPKTATLVFTQVGWVHKKAAHPNAGLLLENYLMCPEGQAILNGNGEGVSPIPDVKGAIALAEGTKVVPIDLGQYTEDDFKAINDTWSSTFK